MGVLPGTFHFLRDLVVGWGLLGIFVASFLGSTIFIPFSVEAVEAVLLGLKQNPYLVVLVASLGSLLGTCVNYWIGYAGSGLIEKRVGQDNINKAKHFMDKHGWPGLFLVIFLPTPIPVDPVTVIPGLMRMNFAEFSVVVFVAKVLRYAVVAAALMGFFGFVHI